MNLSLPGFGKKSVVGLDIGSNSVKAVEIAMKGKDKGFELKSLGIAPMPAEAIVQGAFLNSSAIVDSIQEADPEWTNQDEGGGGRRRRATP